MPYGKLLGAPLGNTAKLRHSNCLIDLEKIGPGSIWKGLRDEAEANQGNRYQ